MKKIFACLIAALLCAATVSACSAHTAETHSSSEAANPVVEQDSFEKMNQAVGFEMPVLPEKYKPEAYAIIAETLAQVDYGMEGTEAKINFRMAEGTEDISGIYGVEAEQKTINGISVNQGIYNDTLIVWFVDNGYTYALTATGMTGTDFATLVNDATTLLKMPAESQITELE